MTMIHRGLPTPSFATSIGPACRALSPASSRRSRSDGHTVNPLGDSGAKPDRRPPRGGEADGKDRPDPAHVGRRSHAVAGVYGCPVKYKGWVLDFDAGPEGDRFKLEEAQNAETLLLGRVTYEAMHAFWPQRKVSSPTG
jgi:hypothetical protein